MPDYIVVGAGSAGCVLAARLTEDPDVPVTAARGRAAGHDGQHPHPARLRPLSRTEVDWDYATAPRAAAATGRRIYLPRGKTLGGSSSINAMVYIRGNRARLRRVGRAARRAGATTTCCPTSSARRTTSAGRTRYHGAGGPLAVSEERSRNEMSRAFVEAGRRPAIARNDDFNGAEQDGVGALPG